MKNALTPYSRKLLAQRESIIESGLHTFAVVGHALLSIRDERLYREDYDSFDAYVRGRWHMGKSRAYQLIAAAELSTSVDIDNEAQARELAGLTPEQAADVVDETKAENDGKLTAPAIRKTRKKRAKKNAQHTNEGTDVDGEVAEGDVSTQPDDGANGHDVGRSEPESVPSPIVIDATAREECSLHRCEHCGAEWDANAKQAVAS